ncbi:NERD domain-containing protein [Leptothermofonsia sichuanensis E412]|uniref:nuclease-related domain-containing protein n=1 Tax=Leptothermofonsia sichuanensis TaxID=2917832 RepID=UPI001CA60252|nr:nuclease-related domain-containing protein [Leptothermofonsia sichuanensis]QZZ22185.1 NERD domain-containing protein [Leptothermofonsia sichuanensis E412]
MDFHPFTPFDNNAAQNKVWDWLKQAFRQDEGVAYYRYPIFRRIGQLQREPDILLLHRELGLWVIECKGCCIRNIVSIQGHDWTMQEWHSESEAPIAQAEDQMFAVQNKLTERRETRGLVSCNFRVALPFVRWKEWQDREFDANPVTQGTVLVYEDLTPAALRNNLTEAAQCHTNLNGVQGR